MGILPRVNNCCFCVDLKIGTILICVYTIIIAGGSAGYAASGPCRAYYISGLSRNLGFGITFLNICLLVAAILVLIYAIFDLDALQFACPAYVWIALITCLLSIILVIVQYVLSDAYDKEYCSWIPYIVTIVLLCLFWIYWAIVVESFCGDS